MVVKIGVYDSADILIWVQVGNLAKVLCVDDMDNQHGLVWRPQTWRGRCEFRDS